MFGLMIIKAVLENVSIIITSFVINHLQTQMKNKNFLNDLNQHTKEGMNTKVFR